MALGWHTLETNGDSPGPRSRHGLVYDSTTESIVLFGGIDWRTGNCQSDTWELREQQWTRIELQKSPAPRHRGAMVFDSKRGRSVLFAGQSQNVTGWPMLNDTWVYEDHQWTLRPAAGWFWQSPPLRCGHAMAFDEEIGVTVMFGGINPYDQPLGDTWTYDGKRWSQLKGDAPPARRYAAFAFDPELKGCVLHGGEIDDNGHQKFGDTWLFRGGTWTAMGKNFETATRDDHGLAFHHGVGRMVMLEGLLRDARGGIKREVLMMSQRGWQPIEVDPLHQRLQCSPLAYDPKLGGLVMHGGETGHRAQQFDKTLVLKLDGTSRDR